MIRSVIRRRIHDRLALTLGLALLLAVPAAAQTLRESPRLSNIQAEPIPQVITGTLSGVVLEDVSCDNEAASAIVGIAGTSIQALGEGGSASAVTGPDGGYQLTLDQGTYQVEATTPGGLSTVVEVDVLAGSSVHISFTHDSRDDSFSSSRGSMLLAAGDPDPDTDGNGIVDFADRDYVLNNRGGDPSEVVADVTGDLNGDGSINLLDVQIVDAAFGRSVLPTASHYQAEVTPGGSTATLGDGLATVSSMDGYTLGRLELTGDPAVGRFVVEEDRGTATSPELGDFSFSENSANPSFILFELDTGRVVGGQMTLLLSGGPFGEGYSLDSVIADGIVTMGPSGFESYKLVQVTGTLSGVSSLGTVAFAMCKGEKKKKDKACATVAKPCGVECAVNATCAKNGRCGTCFTSRVGYYDRNGRLWITSCSCSCV